MFTNVLVDIIIVLTILIGAFIGYKRGFFLTITRPVRWFAALLLAFSLCDVVASGIIQPLIEAPLTNQISEYLTEKCGDITPDTVNEKLPTLLKLAAGLVGVDVNGFSGENIIAAITESLAAPAIHLFAVIISFFLIYILSKLLLNVVILILNSIFDNGIIGLFNKILGVFFGTAFSFLIAWVAVMLFGYLVSIPAIADGEWAQGFTGGFFYNLLKSISPLDLLLSF